MGMVYYLFIYQKFEWKGLMILQNVQINLLFALGLLVFIQEKGYTSYFSVSPGMHNVAINVYYATHLLYVAEKYDCCPVSK